MFQSGFRGVWNSPFFKEGFQNSGMICFKPYGGLKLPQIGSDNLFFYIRPLQGHPKPFSDGFRRVLEVFFSVVWNYVVLEGFQSGPKPCLSERFQSDLKPCGFRVVLEGNRVVSEGFQRSETVWF